jgi:hypothetical protein
MVKILPDYGRKVTIQAVDESGNPLGEPVKIYLYSKLTIGRDENYLDEIVVKSTEMKYKIDGIYQMWEEQEGYKEFLIVLPTEPYEFGIVIKYGKLYLPEIEIRDKDGNQKIFHPGEKLVLEEGEEVCLRPPKTYSKFEKTQNNTQITTRPWIKITCERLFR